jgi:hypothetical protein
MSLKSNLKRLQDYAKAIEQAKRMTVAVGLPKEKVGSEVYKDGATVIEVGAKHEFGSFGVKQRSFLRLPFSVKQAEILRATQIQFNKVFEQGRSVDRALSLLGITATNISKEAFVTKGFGQWPDISEETKDNKGSSQVLIDTGILRSYITFIVRG